jgi:uncharacterized cupin superfamily protein
MRPIEPVDAETVPSLHGSPYPEPFASFASSTEFRPLADHFGLGQFGVNHVTLNPGSQSGLRHWHSLEDEFIFILRGQVQLLVGDKEFLLRPGMCAGFKAGDRNAHLTRNPGPDVAQYLIIGSRIKGDVSFYPDDDLAWFETETGTVAVHKDGTAYEPSA